VLGYTERDRKEWMNSGTIKQTREAKIKLNMAKTRQQKIQLNQQVKKVWRDIRRRTDNQAQKAEEVAKRGNMKTLCDTMRASINKPKMGRPIKSKELAGTPTELKLKLALFGTRYVTSALTTHRTLRLYC
jgi:hypothetical protein